jgi:hypothetical protein
MLLRQLRDGNHDAHRDQLTIARRLFRNRPIMPKNECAGSAFGLRDAIEQGVSKTP